jgi:hypothetical protein
MAIPTLRINLAEIYAVRVKGSDSVIHEIPVDELGTKYAQYFGNEVAGKSQPARDAASHLSKALDGIRGLAADQFAFEVLVPVEIAAVIPSDHE